MKNSLLAIVFSLTLTPLWLAADSPPNVVLIFVDDLGYGDLGCYGATKVQTPNIDRLAAEGRRFTDAHSASAVCTPSRYALLTGQYPLRGRAKGGQGIWGPAPVTSPLLVDTEKVTIADVFKKAGYDTAVMGKWHLGFKEGTNDWQAPLRPGPQDLGFDYYFGMPVVNSAPPYVYVENDRIVGEDPDDPLVYLGRNAKGATPITPIPPEAAQRSANAFGGAKKAHRLFNDYQVGTTLAKKSVEWIEQRKDKPFFLYLATTNIHHPFTPAKRFQGTSQCGLYGDFIHELDWIVGEVLTCIEDNGLSDNTLVIFTSDNGGMFNFGGQAAFKAGHRQNGDLLGFKFGVWEGGHRVPMIVRWPGKVKAGTISNQLISNVDMLATFAALTQQKLDKGQQTDSVNMMPAITGEPKDQIRDHLILAPNKGTHLSVRKGKWMYIPRQGSGGFGGRKPSDHTFAGPAAASFVGSVNSDIENGKIKPDAPPAQLYDLDADPNQTANLHDQNPDVVKELASLLASYPVPRSSGSGKGKAAPGKNKKSSRKPATKSEAKPSEHSVSFDFESGNLEPWKVTKGDFGHLIGSRDRYFKNKSGDYNKQGQYYLTTLEFSPDANRGNDKQTGVIESPHFVSAGGKMTFRVGGGGGEKTYVALCHEDGTELKTARGENSEVMYEVAWDLEPYKGKSLFLKVVDQSENGWGHVTLDDFQFDAEILTDSKDEESSGDRLEQNVKTSATGTRRSKPNFVVIFADDLGFGDISCYHAKGVQTPHLDALAANGFRSTDFFVPANVCSPSRAALLTGRYPMRCGMPVARNESVPKYKDYGFAADEVTIPELLKPAGYHSLMVGKWHLGLEVEGSHPIDAGFDEHLGIPSNYAKNRGSNHNTLYRGRKVERRNVPCQALTKLYTDEVVEFIKRQNDDPFFIYVSHHIVHSPLLPSKDFVGTSKKGKYGDFVKELDHSTGRIMQAIKDAGVVDNTLVVFTSDNGPTRNGSAGRLACTCEIAWNQGVDLYGAYDNRLLKGYEYTAKYNLGFDVPYEPYRSFEGRYHYKKISDESRGRLQSIYEKVLNHYKNRKGLNAEYTRQAVMKLREGSVDRSSKSRRSRRSSSSALATLMFANQPSDLARPTEKTNDREAAPPASRSDEGPALGFTSSIFLEETSWVAGDACEQEKAAAFYVAPAGSDMWSGTLDEPNPEKSDGPFATIERARDAVRGLKRKHNKDIVVLIRGGTYQIDKTIVFGLEDSATGESSVTYAAFPGEIPVFRSSRAIREWKLVDSPIPGLPEQAIGKVRVARVTGQFRALFDQDGLLPRARSMGFIPLKGSSRNELRFPDGRLKNWPNIEDVEVVVRPHHAWIVNILPLKSVDEQKHIAHTSIDATYAMNQLHFLKQTESCWVENTLEELDQPGEWVLNSQEGKLYLWPRNDSSVFAPQMNEMVNQQRDGVDKKSLAVDPLFVDPNKGDFRFQPESPAFKLGIVSFDRSKVGLRTVVPTENSNPQDD